MFSFKFSLSPFLWREDVSISRVRFHASKSCWRPSASSSISTDRFKATHLLQFFCARASVISYVTVCLISVCSSSLLPLMPREDCVAWLWHCLVIITYMIYIALFSFYYFCGFVLFDLQSKIFELRNLINIMQCDIGFFCLHYLGQLNALFNDLSSFFDIRISIIMVLLRFAKCTILCWNHLCLCWCPCVVCV